MDTEDFNFFDDAPQTESQPLEQPAQEPQQQTPTIDPSEVAQLREQVQSFDRWKQEASRFFSGQGGNPNSPDPQAELMAMLQNPTAFKQDLISQATSAAREEMVWDSAIQAAEQQYPHLIPFKNAIMSQDNMQEAAKTFHQKNGRAPNPGREMVEAARENFENRLRAYQTATSQQQVANQMRSNALNLSVGGDPAPRGRLTADQIRTMPDTDFDALYNQVMRA
jgi:hypothetical protein